MHITESVAAVDCAWLEKSHPILNVLSLGRNSGANGLEAHAQIMLAASCCSA